MTNITNFQDILGAANGDKTSVLGKFLYFSLANILVEKEALAQLCEDLNIPYSSSKRISVSDAFRSATGDIKDRITVKNPGAHHIYAVYCRDNAHTEDVYSRELVKETLNQRTNQYEKLANIFYDRRDNRFGYDNIGFDADKANEMLARLNIAPNARLKTLSKGNKEKVQLVLAMSRNARLYLLDEPIGGVDPAARDYILNTIISNYSKDATVVISTHLIEDIEPVLDEAVFLKDGKIFAHRAVDDIRETEGKSVDAYFREVFKC